LLVLILAAAVPLKGIPNFYIDKTGYEHCIFNLVDYNSRETAESTDLTETLLAQNVGFQLWTVTMLPHEKYQMTNYSADREPFIDSLYLKESCSVNFFVANIGRYKRNLFLIFGYRFFAISTKNTLLIYVAELANYGSIIALPFGLVPIYMDIFVLSVPNTGVGITNALCICLICPRKSIIMEPENVISLYQMKADLENLKQGSIRKTVIARLPMLRGVEFENDKISSCTWRHTHFETKTIMECLPEGRFIQTVSVNLNWSVLKVPGEQVTPKSNFILQGHARGIISGTSDDWPYSGKFFPLNYFMYFFLDDMDTMKFMYCSEQFERETFNLLFWSVPFDTLTWVGIGAVLVIISILLRGNWIDVVGILLRQSAALLDENKVMLVLLMLACIVITCGYESIISGFLTVPPPVVVFTSLQDLLDNGLKILVGSISFELWEIIFEVNNITSHDLESTLVSEDGLTYRELTFMLAAGNTTKLFEFYRDISRYEMQGKTCYLAPQTEHLKIHKYWFCGYEGWKLYEGMCRLFESGIMNLYQRFSDYRDYIIWKPKEEYFLFMESLPLAFVMSDWKMCSIFIVWSALVALACFAFITEYWK